MRVLEEMSLSAGFQVDEMIRHKSSGKVNRVTRARARIEGTIPCLYEQGGTIWEHWSSQGDEPYGEHGPGMDENH